MASTLIQRAQEALGLIQAGREALIALKETVYDGSVAISTSDKKELEKMLDAEEEQTREVSTDLKKAIEESRR